MYIPKPLRMVQDARPNSGGEEEGCLNRSAYVSVFLLMLFFSVILCRVPGTHPIAALCLPLRIFLTRMISARNPARHLQLRETPYPGICLNMRDRKERFKGAPCWTLLRGLCLGSQVSTSSEGDSESCGNAPICSLGATSGS